jgi:tetratricopeptide (TPR) repeat protein
MFEHAFGDQELYLQARGALLFGTERLADAAESFKAAIAEHPTSLNYLCLFNCYRSLGLFEQAFEIVEEGIRQVSDPYGLIVSYAATKFTVGDVGRANEIFRRVRNEYLTAR